MALSKFSEDYDFFFRNAPLRDLKQVHAHFLPSGLKFIVTKQAVLLGLFNGPKLLTLARDDPSIVAKILAKRVALDLAYTSVRRALERTALALLEEELAARFFRGKSAGLLFFCGVLRYFCALPDPSRAATEALEVELLRHSSGVASGTAPAFAFLQQRFRLAVHTFGVVPYPGKWLGY